MMKEFLNFIAEIMEIPAESISLETTQDSVEEWDSLMHLRLLSELEEKYKIQIPLDKVSEIITLGDFYKYIED